MKSENVASLLEVIVKERACCNRLIDVNRNEQKSLVDNNLESLSGRTSDMQKAVGELQRLQTERKKIISLLAKELGIDDDKISLNTLADKLDTDEASTLRGKFRELTRTGEVLYQLNQQTIYLINFSLDLLERQIGAWTGALTEDDGYRSDGQAKAGPLETRIVEEKA